MADEQPIIIVKKKGGHAGHHGGAWKVAYSDFITSMMCFFLVMWLVTTASGSTKKGIAEYFKDPGIFDKTKHGSPLEIGASGLFPDEGYQPKEKSGKDFSKIQNKINRDETKDDKFANGTHVNKGNTKDEKLKDDPEAKVSLGELINAFNVKMGNSKKDIEGNNLNGNSLSLEETQQVLNELKAKIKASIEEKLKQEILGDNPALSATQNLKDFLGDVEITVDGNAINIDIIDNEKVSMFPLGSSEMGKKSKDALYEIAKTLKGLPNDFEIVGHTDAVPYSGKSNYSNWELSSERANAARRILEDAGIDPNKIVSVQGRADRDLKVKDDPYSPKNRRITLRMNFSNEDIVNIKNDSPTKVKEDIFEKINMRINEHRVKSITTNEDIDDSIEDSNDDEIIKLEENHNKEVKENIDKKENVDLNRQQELEEIIKRNSKKPSINLEDSREKMGKVLGAPAPIIF